MNKKLRKLRKLVGLTQWQLANPAKIRFGRIAYFELGRAELTPDELQRIERALRKQAEKIAEGFAV